MSRRQIRGLDSANSYSVSLTGPAATGAPLRESAAALLPVSLPAEPERWVVLVAPLSLFFPTITSPWLAWLFPPIFLSPGHEIRHASRAPLQPHHLPGSCHCASALEIAALHNWASRSHSVSREEAARPAWGLAIGMRQDFITVTRPSPARFARNRGRLICDFDID